MGGRKGGIPGRGRGVGAHRAKQAAHHFEQGIEAAKQAVFPLIATRFFLRGLLAGVILGVIAGALGWEFVKAWGLDTIAGGG